jgi:hypothetical protein
MCFFVESMINEHVDRGLLKHVTGKCSPGAEPGTVDPTSNTPSMDATLFPGFWNWILLKQF